MAIDHSCLYILALTPNGMALASRIQALLKERGKEAIVWLPQTLVSAHVQEKIRGFESLSQVMEQAFEKGIALICIMATGIVVRSIAPFLKGKVQDPAVVVMDETGRFVISLLSGHMGGANALAQDLAGLMKATPVITTASDVNGLPSLDLLAQRHGLLIEDIKAVKAVQSALLRKEMVYVLDETTELIKVLSTYGLKNLHGVQVLPEPLPKIGVYVGIKKLPCLKDWLLLRPQELVVGVGCNRGTTTEEITSAIGTVFKNFEISILCIKTLASIDAKQNEEGLLRAGEKLKVGIVWHLKERLKKIQTPNPSLTVVRHMGVASVCEAAALLTVLDLGYKTGQLLVPKQKLGNVTVAVARGCSM